MGSQILVELKHLLLPLPSQTPNHEAGSKDGSGSGKIVLGKERINGSDFHTDRYKNKNAFIGMELAGLLTKGKERRTHTRMMLYC